MAIKEEYIEKIEKIRTKSGLLYYGFVPKLIRLVFLKYMCDFSSDKMAGEGYRILRDLQSSMYNANVTDEILNDAWNVVTDTFEINTISEIHKFYDFLTKSEDQENILAALNTLNIPRNHMEMKEFLLYIISLGERDITKTASSSSNTSLIELAQKVLNVKEDERYMDCFCGYNKSSMIIDANHIVGYELDPEVAVVSTMLMIMCGKKDFKILNLDYYACGNWEKANKVFSDGPIGKKNEIYNAKFALENLEENGKAFVTVPGSFLFSTSKNLIDQRKELLPYISSVIALPALWYGTSVPTFALVLENKENINNIMFIDASKEGSLTKNKTYMLTADSINSIINSLNGEEVKGFAKVIVKKDIDSECNLLPSRYMEIEDKKNFRSSLEIQNDLDELYGELKKILN